MAEALRTSVMPTISRLSEAERTRRGAMQSRTTTRAIAIAVAVAVAFPVLISKMRQRMGRQCAVVFFYSEPKHGRRDHDGGE